MQGLVNFASAIADGIAVLLPAMCYIAAATCFYFAAWTLRAMAAHHHHHHHWQRPWVPWISLLLSGVFASFPHLLTIASVSAGNGVVASITAYQATTPGSAANVLGATPTATVVNVVTLFEHFFQVFGAACVWWSIWRWRSIINGAARGSPMACLIQFTFGVMCINTVVVAKGVVALFSAGG